MQIIQPKITLPPSLAIPSYIIKIAKVLDFISTTISARIAMLLFFTPIKYPKPKREKAMWNSAQKQDLRVPSINKEIQVLTYGYSKKKVLLVHGWAGRSTQLYLFADRLLEKGYMVVSFAAPAHGKSEGKTTSLPEFINCVKEIKHTYGPFQSIIGHSLGGTASLNAASDFLGVKSVVAIGAGNKSSEVVFNFCNTLGLSKKTAFKLITLMERKFKMPVDSFASESAAKKLTIPVLIVHDSLDGDVPVSSGQRIRQNLTNGQLLITHGLGHTKILRDLNVVKKCITFIQENQ